MTKIDIVLINNYPMDHAYALWQNGKSGSHHVWGKVELERDYNYNFILFQHVKFPLINRIGKLFGIGFLDQQVRLLFSKSRDYILYLPYASSNSKLLLLLKCFGFFQIPMVSLIHQPFLGSKSKSKIKWLVAKKGILLHDAVIFLSNRLMQDTVHNLDIDPSKTATKFFTAQWGPDSEFYQKYANFSKPHKECKYFIAAGHTCRDYDTLIEAFRAVDYPLRIYCTESTVPNRTNLPSNVTIYSSTIPYAELLNYYSDALAILIPMKYAPEEEGCQGMTSLQDVVALGKPTIITKNKSLNIDPEEEGFGMNVDMFDVEGWRSKINILIRHEDVWEKMVSRAKFVYKNKFNSNIFAEVLHKAFQTVNEG